MDLKNRVTKLWKLSPMQPSTILVTHLLYKCRFTKRIWKEIISWRGINGAPIALWDDEASVVVWWTKVALERGKERKAMASIVIYSYLGKFGRKATLEFFATFPPRYLL
jgi:hypothetical protein